jgi:hypothetical protein
MSNKLSAVLVLCMSTMCLAGCDLLRITGPCYGVGCPGGTAGHSGQYKAGEAPKAQNASAAAPAKSVMAPTQSAAAQAKPVQPNAPAQTASASTTAQPAATQSPATASTTAQATTAQTADAQTVARPASPEAKPSPLHSIGEFFAHLIPHHNSGAKSGAAD